MNKLKEKGPSLWSKIKSKLPNIQVCLKPTKTKVGKVAFVVVPLVVAAVGASFGIYLTEKTNTTKTPVTISANKVNHRVYLVNADDLTIPLTVSINKRETTQEEMLEVFDLLKEDSKANTGTIKGLIPKDTKLKEIELFEKELMLDFSKEFLNYSTTSEDKLLESIVYTFSEFPDVESISLYVEGERLDKLPKNNTAVPMCITTNIGINRETKKAIDVAGKQMINVYYQKTIGDKAFMVPVSQYVSKDDTIEVQLVNAINQPLTESKGLKLQSDYSLINKIQTDDTDKFVLNVNQESLVEEGVVKRSLYDLVSLTMTNLVSAKDISFIIENEEVQVEGLLDSKTYEVANYVYNQVEI